MAEFKIITTSESKDVHNTIVTLHCEIPETKQLHDVKVHVSNLPETRSRIRGSIVQFARSWAEPKLRAAASLTAVSELRIHATNVDER